MESILNISFEVPETTDVPAQVLRPARLRPTRSNALSTHPQLDGLIDELVPIAHDHRTLEGLAPQDRPAQRHFFDVCRPLYDQELVLSSPNLVPVM